MASEAAATAAEAEALPVPTARPREYGSYATPPSKMAAKTLRTGEGAADRTKTADTPRKMEDEEEKREEQRRAACKKIDLDLFGEDERGQLAAERGEDDGMRTEASRKERRKEKKRRKKEKKRRRKRQAKKDSDASSSSSSSDSTGSTARDLTRTVELMREIEDDVTLLRQKTEREHRITTMRDHQSQLPEAQKQLEITYGRPTSREEKVSLSRAVLETAGQLPYTLEVEHNKIASYIRFSSKSAARTAKDEMVKAIRAGFNKGLLYIGFARTQVIRDTAAPLSFLQTAIRKSSKQKSEISYCKEASGPHLLFLIQEDGTRRLLSGAWSSFGGIYHVWSNLDEIRHLLKQIELDWCERQQSSDKHLQRHEGPLPNDIADEVKKLETEAKEKGKGKGKGKSKSKKDDGLLRPKSESGPTGASGPTGIGLNQVTGLGNSSSTFFAGPSASNTTVQMPYLFPSNHMSHHGSVSVAQSPMLQPMQHQQHQHQHQQQNQQLWWHHQQQPQHHQCRGGW